MVERRIAKEYHGQVRVCARLLAFLKDIILNSSYSLFDETIRLWVAGIGGDMNKIISSAEIFECCCCVLT